jgi:calcium binding protein 39
MNALRDRSRSIQFEAFHIFKIFAANPNKHPEVIVSLLQIVKNGLTNIDLTFEN